MLRLAQNSSEGEQRPLRIVAVLTALAADPEADLAKLREHFCSRSIPATLVDSGLHTSADGHEPEVIRRIEDADLVLIGGGDPVRLVEQTTGTPALAALRARHQAGLVVAACSAGAIATGAGMIIGPAEAREATTSWAWFTGLLVAPHFGQYDHGAWFAEFPEQAMLGIADNAIALISNDSIQSLGPEPLTIIRPGHQAIQLDPTQSVALDLQR